MSNHRGVMSCHRGEKKSIPPQPHYTGLHPGDTVTGVHDTVGNQSSVVLVQLSVTCFRFHSRVTTVGYITL